MLKIGVTMASAIIPFTKLETDEDFEKLNELARNSFDFFAELADAKARPSAYARNAKLLLMSKEDGRRDALP